MRKSLSVYIFILAIGLLFVRQTGYAMEALQTQASVNGKFLMHITSLKIKRDVLTIMLVVKNISGKKAEGSFYYKKVYYMDMEGKKKYFVLKDSEGQYIAGPKAYDTYGGEVVYTSKPGDQKIIWMKFPAPPVTTKTIDLFIPGMLPLEDIQLDFHNQPDKPVEKESTI